MNHILHAEHLQVGGRPALRIAVHVDGAAQTVVEPLVIYPHEHLWSAYWWDPDTGRFGYGRAVEASTGEPIDRPGVVDIPRDLVAEARGQVIEPTEPERTEVDRLERDGKRTLRVGQFVECQPKERKGTGKVAGTIARLWAGGQVEVATGVTTVEVASEWVRAKNHK